MTFEEFKNDVMNMVDKCPDNWRKGQSVFNVIDAKYHVAREVQIVEKIDCFYDNYKIDEFIKKAFETYKKIC